MTPGYVAGALLVFIWTFSDFATPLILGVQDLLAAQAYPTSCSSWTGASSHGHRHLRAHGHPRHCFPPRGAPLGRAQRLLHALVFRDGAPRLSGAGQAGALGFLSLVLLLSFIPYVGVALAACSRGWSLTPLPVAYTLQHFERVIVETPKYVVNSFLYSGWPSSSASWWACPSPGYSGRSTMRGRGVLDSLNTLILAVRVPPSASPTSAPSTSISRLRPWPHLVLDRHAAHPRRSTPALHGAGRFSSPSPRAPLHGGGGGERGRFGRAAFRDVTLPLIWKGIVVGGLFSS